jgi:hypothetical protein
VYTIHARPRVDRSQAALQSPFHARLFGCATLGADAAKRRCVALFGGYIVRRCSRPLSYILAITRGVVWRYLVAFACDRSRKPAL